MDRNLPDDNSPHHDQSLPRRRLLELLSSTGLGATAGCSGVTGIMDDESPDRRSRNPEQQAESESESDRDATPARTTVGILCDEINTQFVPYDANTTALVCNCEVPSAIAQSLNTREATNHHQAFRTVDATTTGGLALNIVQTISDASVTDTPTEFNDRPREFTVDFNDESVPLYGQPPADDSSTETLAVSRLDGSLPYGVDGTRLYFPIMIQLTVQAGEPIPDSCRKAVTTTTHQIGETLERNPKSTVADAVEE